LSKEKLQINNTFTDTENPIFDLIIKYTHHSNTYPKPPITPPPHLLALYNYPPPSHRISHDPSYNATLKISPYRTGKQQQYSVVGRKHPYERSI
jgi:hypothetical protein